MLLMFLTALSPHNCPCQPGDDKLESQVKAAYIYNFTKFVRWNDVKSDSLTNPVCIGILGALSIGDILKNFSDKQSGGRLLVVKDLELDKMSSGEYQLIFIGQAQQKQIPALLRMLDGTDILTVSDSPDFTRHGGMIGFYIENGKVKIEINIDAVNNSKLKISAKLLEVAKIISMEKK